MQSERLGELRKRGRIIPIDGYSSEVARMFWQGFADAIKPGEILTLDIIAKGKPTMNKADAWKGRPVVLNWWDYKAELLEKLSEASICLPCEPCYLHWLAFIPIPPSWKDAERERILNTLHDKKPDRSNITKGLEDCLFVEDMQIGSGWSEKRWCLPGQERIEIYAE